MMLNNKDCDRKQRFGIRKLTVGACSVLLATLFIAISGNTKVHADAKDAAQTEQVDQKAQDSSAQAEDQNKAAADKDALTSTAKQTQAAKTNDQAAEPVKTEAAKTTADTTAAKTDAKQAAAKGQETKAAQPAQPAKAEAKKAEQTADQDKVDTSIWNYTKQADGITLTGLKSNPVKDGKIIVPNSYDFAKAGIIQEDQKVYIGDYFKAAIWEKHDNLYTSYDNDATELKFSTNGGGKVTAPANLGDYFISLPFETIDVSGLDVSGVTNMTQTFMGVHAKQIIGLDTWDVSNVRNMGSMFYAAGGLEKLSDLSNWNTANVTSFRAMFSGDGHLNSIGDIHNWNVSQVNDMTQMFMGTSLKEINMSGWNMANVTSVDHMFTVINQPVLIDMRNVTLPTKTSFKLLDFMTKQPMVVYASQGSKLFDFNTTKFDNYFDQSIWVGFGATTGRQNTNKIVLTTTKGELVTIPMDFVYTDKAALISALKAKTTESSINDLVHSKFGKKVNADPAQFENGSLKFDVNQAATDLVVSKFQINLVGEQYTQVIEYKDANGKVVKTAKITGYLGLNDAPSTLAASDLANAISSNAPAGYKITSAMPTSDLVIKSTKPEAVVVTVAKEVSAQIVYRDAKTGKTVKTDTINGLAGDNVKLNIQVPEGYEVVGVAPESYTFTDGDNQQIMVNVQAQEHIAPPVNPTDPVDPVTPVNPVNPDTPVVPAPPVNPEVKPDKPNKNHAAEHNTVRPLPAQKPTYAGKTNVKASANQTNNQAASHKQATLPQTGAKQSTLMAVIGGLLALVALLAVVLPDKSRKD